MPRHQDQSSLSHTIVQTSWQASCKEFVALKDVAFGKDLHRKQALSASSKLKHSTPSIMWQSETYETYLIRKVLSLYNGCCRTLNHQQKKTASVNNVKSQKNTPAYERFSHDTIDAAQNPKPQAKNDSLNVKSQKKTFWPLQHIGCIMPAHSYQIPDAQHRPHTISEIK